MPNSNLHKDRIVLVTGASRGIGRAASLALADLGAHVIAVSRTQSALETLDDEIASKPGNVTLIPADLTNDDILTRLPDAIAERFGRLDGFLANAGVLGDLTPVTDVLPKMWRNAFAINVDANARLLAGLDPLLRQSDAARVVGITTGRVRKTTAYWAAYSASKAAFESLMLTYAAEMAETSVRVNLVDPGPIATGMRAKAMPGEDPKTIPAPASLAPHITAALSPEECRHGEVISAREALREAIEAV